MQGAPERMNKSATRTESDTRLTQPCSADVRPIICDAFDIIAIVGTASAAVAALTLVCALAVSR